MSMILRFVASPVFTRTMPGREPSMTPGVYDIPVPDGTELVMPDAALVPMNGFDAQGYRLGYGGGYFDRTLAAAMPRPLAIGIGFEFARLYTIHPQSHDIPMDFVVTEAGLHTVIDASLVYIDAGECHARVQRLCEQRGLPLRPRSTQRELSSPVCYAREFPEHFGETEGKC